MMRILCRVWNIFFLFLLSCQNLPPAPTDELRHTPVYRIVEGVDNLEGLSYDKLTDTYYAMSSGPSRLTLLNSSLNPVKSIPLPFFPEGFSIQPELGYAVFIHDDTLYSVIDIQSSQIYKTGSTPHYGASVVLAANGWLYTGIGGLGGTIYFRDLAADSPLYRYDHGWIGVGEILVLHPSGEYLYGASRGWQPGKLVKFDISSGVLKPIAGIEGNNIQQDLWISEDGEQLYSAGNGRVYSGDCVYLGQLLPAPDYLARRDQFGWVAHFGAINRIIASRPDSSRLYYYNAESLELQGIIDLPKFPLDDHQGSGSEVSVSCEYIFVNSGNDKATIIGKAVGTWLMTQFDSSMFLQ